MVISKKISEKEIKKFIEKGGSVTKAEEKKESFVISLKMPTWMKHDIDNLIKEKAGYSRTSWILQAIQKELEKQNQGD